MDWFFIIRIGLLVFWALWLTLVFLTNLFDGLKAAGVLPGSWRFASGNYQAMGKVTGKYGTPGWLLGLLFAGVIVWELLAAALLWRAALTFGGAGGSGMMYMAFTVSLALWAAFILADEVFSAYEMSQTHWAIFIAQLVSLLAVGLLPA